MYLLILNYIESKFTAIYKFQRFIRFVQFIQKTCVAVAKEEHSKSRANLVSERKIKIVNLLSQIIGDYLWCLWRMIGERKWLESKSKSSGELRVPKGRLSDDVK